MHAFENLGKESQSANKLKGCNRGVTMTTDLSTLSTTASHNVAYDFVGEAAPSPAQRFRAAASKTSIAGGTLMDVPNTDFALAGTWKT